MTALKQRADSSRTIRLEPRTQHTSRITMLSEPIARTSAGVVNMDLTPFFDGPDHVAELGLRAIKHGGSQVRIGEAGPGSLHTGHEVGLTYDVLTRSQVEAALPELVFLHDNPASACLRQATGDDYLVPLPGERGINVNVTSGGHVHEWHVGGPDLAYTSSTGLIVPMPGAGLPWEDVVYVDASGAVVGGAAEEPGTYLAAATAYDPAAGAQVQLPGVVESLRDRWGCVRVDPATPGAFVWHDGARKHATLIEPGKTLVAPGMTPHGVNGVPPGFVRVTLIMSWVWREDLEAAQSGGGRYAPESEQALAGYLYGDDGHSGALSTS